MRDAAATAGRGLQIVSDVAADWGWELEPDGKVVWFELLLREESVSA